MSYIRLSKKNIKILNLINRRGTLTAKEVSILLNDYIQNTILDINYLYENKYLVKNFPNSENKLVDDEYVRVSPKGNDYLENLKFEFWDYIKKSIFIPIFLTIVTYILCSYLEKYFK